MKAAWLLVKGLARFKSKLSAVPARVKQLQRQRLAFYADKIVASAEGFVPQDEGDLLASIGWTWGDQVPPGTRALGSITKGSPEPDMVITIFAGSVDTIVTNSRGIEFQNALIQEFGREGDPGQPYFRPAFEQHRRAASNGLRREAKRAWREVLTR